MTREEFLTIEYPKIIALEKKLYDWENIRNFNPEKHQHVFPETVDSTREFGELLKKSGIDVAYIYSPTTCVFNDFDQQIAEVTKSKLVKNVEEGLEFIRENYQGKTIFLYQYMKDFPVDEKIDKIRFFAIDLKVKYEINQ